MGQILRIMSYDRSANERNAILGLNLLGNALKWHRLDDGVMGGRSETTHHVESVNGKQTLHFSGQINTQGGGFCSIRSPVQGGLPSDTTAIRISYVGDGKTYKFLLSDGNKSTFGPSRRSPSWQADIPTNKKEETRLIQLDSLTPSMIGGPVDADVVWVLFDFFSRLAALLMASRVSQPPYRFLFFLQRTRCSMHIVPFVFGLLMP